MAVGFVVATSLVGGACGVDRSRVDAERDADGAVVAAESIGVFRLRPFDCVDLPGRAVADGETKDLVAVPCDRPHDGQVATVVDLEVADDGAAPYPGRRLAAAATQRCGDRIELELGIDLSTDETWNLVHLYPSPESWEAVDDREVVCVLVPAEDAPTATIPPSG